MSNEDVGVITGGVAGGLLGSTLGGGSGKAVAIAVGTIAGAIIGGAVGKDMDENDRLRMEQALENNAVGEPTYWHNAHTGSSYRVVPMRNVTVYGNRYCREYHTIVIIDGREHQMYRTACRQANGAWRVVD